MPVIFRRSKTEIQNQILTRLARNTSITSLSPGSVARALVDGMAGEMSNLYEIMDFNLRQQYISTAAGQGLDMMGVLYNVERKTLSNLITIDKMTNSFYFYLETPHSEEIRIPAGTNVFTDVSSFLGQQFSYSTTEEVVLPAGRLRVSTSIKPNFIESVFTAGAGTIVYHDFDSPVGVSLKCTNPKSISSQIGYEDDESYRSRIMKAIRVSASGTEDAIRFAALAVPGVRDVKVRQAQYGYGSFGLIVVPEDLSTSSTLLNQVNTALDRVRPLGVRMYTQAPTTASVDIDIQLVTQTTLGSLTQSNIIARAKSEATRFVSRLLPGDTLVYNRFIQSILDSSEYVRDLIITRYAVGGLELPRRNYQSEPEVLLVPGTIRITIAS